RCPRRRSGGRASGRARATGPPASSPIPAIPGASSGAATSAPPSGATTHVVGAAGRRGAGAPPAEAPLQKGERAMILERFKVPAKDQVMVSEAALRRTVAQIFEKLGLTPEDAAEGADVLTMTDLRGVET